MKSRALSSIAFAGLSTCLFTLNLPAGTPLSVPDGVTIGPATNTVLPWNTAGMQVTSAGSLLLSSSHEDNSWLYNGGMYLSGAPIRMLLGADNGAGTSDDALGGSFEIWCRGLIGNSHDPVYQFYCNPTGPSTAYFRSNLRIFDDSSSPVAGNLIVDGYATVGGALTVAGSSVLTQTSAPAFFKTAQGKLEIGSTASATASGAVAFGANSLASNTNAFAAGINTTASGPASIALGNGAKADGWYAVALGTAAHASGGNSFAGPQAVASGQADVAFAGGSSYGNHGFSTGEGSVSRAENSVSIGMFNVDETTATIDNWLGTDSIFTVGNGTDYPSAARSNALVTLKNGSTTLTNKAWKASVSAGGDPLASQDATTASGGAALTVEGHTVLKGKVTIEKPQGDISMGNFGTP